MTKKNYHKTTSEIIKTAKALCEKFINKVETGRAISNETYAECKTLLKMINENNKRKRIK